MTSPILVRAGVPLTGGTLVEYAKARGLPVLMSANAFAKRAPRDHPEGRRFEGFKQNLSVLDGMDIALDSAGYVATRLYGDYEWTAEAYVALAAARPWSWWSSLDFCMEPEVASDEAMRRIRLAATAVNYGRCTRLAREAGIADPLPVLQGWEVGEYLTCVDWMPLVEWPALVGVGSMCRRPVHGPNGVLAIVEALDKVLPAHCRLHLFGVKSTALAYLAGHVHEVAGASRIGSIDSLAWDAAARAGCRTGRSMAIRIGYLERWLARQEAEQAKRLRAPALAREPDILMAALRCSIRRIVGERLAQDILDGALEYRDATGMLAMSDCWASGYAQIHGLSASTDREEIEDFLDSVCM